MDKPQGDTSTPGLNGASTKENAETLGAWIVTYKAQGCYDDGGIGHDVTWHQYTHKLTTKATTEAGALAAARRWLRTQRRPPCRGSFCDNVGLNMLVGLAYVVPEQRTEVNVTREFVR